MPNGDGRPTTSFHFLAGLSTGAFSAALLQPADLLKTRIQQPNSGSLLSTFREIAQSSNGLKQLWRGTSPSVIRTGMGSALYFSILEASRQRLSQPKFLSSADAKYDSTSLAKHSSSSLPKLSHLANLTTGAVARVSAGLIMSPITVLKVRFESTLYSYRSMSGAASSIWRNEGVRGFFSGFGATALRDAPYAGLYVLFYEQSKHHLSHLQANTPNGERPTSRSKMSGGTAAVVNFCSGILAACFATTITNPFDVIKTRLQLMPNRYKVMILAGPQMITEDGLRSLFNGLGLRIARKAMSSALTWTLYEELIRRAEVRWRKNEGVPF